MADICLEHVGGCIHCYPVFTTADQFQDRFLSLSSPFRSATNLRDSPVAIFGPFFQKQWMVRFTGSVGVGLGWSESLITWCFAAIYPGSFPSDLALVAPSGVRYLNRCEGTIRHESGGFWLTGALASSTCSVTVRVASGSYT